VATRKERQAQRRIGRARTIESVADEAFGIAERQVDMVESRRDPRIVTKLGLSNQDVVAQRKNARNNLTTAYLRLAVAEQTMRKSLIGRIIFWRYVKHARTEIARINQRSY
jgi:outer membrane protein TolC